MAIKNKYLIEKRLYEKLIRFANRYSEYEAVPKGYGTGEVYYNLEIHTVHLIGENPGINVTEIAARHGISKSAVSRVIKKLERKGTVYRYKANDNNKEVLLGLTEKGQKAFDGHIEYHQNQDISIIEKLALVSNEKLKYFDEVLSIFEEYSKKTFK
jgi:DNA-binding MarR family transcriptional regulator